MPEFSSFSFKFEGLSRVLVSDVAIAPAFDPSTTPLEQQQLLFKPYKGIWDTGATASVITQRIVDELLLKPIGMTNVRHAHGQTQAEVYLVNIFLPNSVAFRGVVVTKGDLIDTDALIGMDIIGRGDFAVSNFNGNTVFSFRIPSIECTDYTGKMTKTGSLGIGRNAPCPCGSGKKYKKCHGSNTQLQDQSTIPTPRV